MKKFELMPSEHAALLDTIRRDYRRESAKAKASIHDCDLHGWNARMSIRLLELLNPKKVAEQSKVTLSLSAEGEESNCP